jgi:hypothetical protein
MIGRNPLLVAQQHGHSPLTMLSVYAAWTAGSLEVDVAAIRRAMRAPLFRCEGAFRAPGWIRQSHGQRGGPKEGARVSRNTEACSAGFAAAARRFGSRFASCEPPKMTESPETTRT